ncbi:MAG: tail fiber domain-containing protein [Bacteroidia bacterium]|nr:tail fiber domain-containing protein [Bacteroidia bacterium]
MKNLRIPPSLMLSWVWLMLCLLPSVSLAQSPQGINYQSVLRDASGIIKNQVVLIRFSIIPRSSGIVSYVETHAENTNEFGLINLTIGSSSTHTGNFSDIAWGSDIFDLKIEVDQGNGFQDMGNTQLQSVPYSLFADKANSVESISLADIEEVSVAQAAIGEVLKWNGTAWIPQADETSDIDADPMNEIQSISLSGNDLSLSRGGGTIRIPQALWNQDSLGIHYDNGRVGILVGNFPAQAPFHVGEGNTVLFGADTLGKSNFFPDPKVMFKPGRGGAFRAGQLNADGSIIGGTGFDFWDPANVGWASVAIGNNTKATGAGSIAIGIRASSTNFGSVALGHLSRTIGNSAVSAGYYTRADAFVSTAVGAGNIGGGSPNAWHADDPIFEVGNSIDTFNRSNAFTVLKNARVGINHNSPRSMLDIEQPNPGIGNGIFLNLSGAGHWETSVDQSADYNFYFNNSLKSYILDSDGSYIKTSDRSLKKNIKLLPDVLPRILQLRPSTYQFKDSKKDAPLSTGFIAQEVEELFPNQLIEKEGIKGLKYAEFSVLAIKAIQEQQDMIEIQAKVIEDLQERLEKLEKELK